MSVSQSQFTRVLMDPNLPVPDGLSDAQSGPAGRRFNVYRNNVAVSLTEAMHAAFPVIAKLLGKENMDGLSGLYLRAHPPSSPLMMFYGASFPAFLAATEQLNHLGYLPDVARLELALRRAYHAADASPIAAEALARIPPEDLMQTRVTLAPSVQVIASSWPIFDIWRFNTTKGAAKPKALAQDVLITRPEFDPIPQPLPAGGACWISALMQGATIGDAHQATRITTAEFDLGTTLTLLLQGGAIINLDNKG
ncbi:HvfC/BufC N-terminal domain-containing protein [Parasedimentitalea psychrophila]|uniref:DNA-binding domain-containing protein n=1 Tax=Parasedimentitalea psychrophila TaxID=2997337 RepID=A0A9Y2P740_9RHOB|nr:DNA-binding domain-containing protein [Parasedimentitalea psychrophila]WIY25395.1 DNA-binding domain-containing protein [Parasedimentitalea psychrophila]